VKTFVATKNLGKLAEMRAIFAGSLLELETYPPYADVEEVADEYIANARLKAAALERQLRDAGIRAAVLADDSGLEVDALDGRPGVLSARYAGASASWAARREALLGELTNVPDDRRAARFVCAMVLLFDDGAELDGVGTIHGSIVRDQRGKSGFGYDPLFVAEGDTRTLAELSEEEKNGVSHRRLAAEALLSRIAAQRV
jgi:XTP/dITP diphosphohydrolase